MTQMLKTACDRVQRRIAYRRTVSELRSLPLDVRLDLDIAGIEDKVASRAIYGR